MRIYKRKASYYVQYRQNGRRVRKSLHTNNREEAEALASKFRLESFEERVFGKVPEYPFLEALLSYAKVQKQNNPRHYRHAMRYLVRDLQGYFGGYQCSQITLPVLERHMQKRMASVSRATVNKEVATVRAILNKAYREGRLTNQPKFPKLKKVAGRTRWLTPEEELRLIKAAAPHMKPIIAFAADTGGRRSEILSLDWQSVDLPNRRITFVRTKNGENRTIRLTERAWAVLKSLGPRAAGPVFVYRGKPVASIKKAWATACEKAGIEGVCFHDLRHTFASRLVQGGVPLYEVMTLLGHKSYEMVQRYSHLAPDFQERAMRVLEPECAKVGTNRPQAAKSGWSLSPGIAISAAV